MHLRNHAHTAIEYTQTHSNAHECESINIVLT